MPSASASFALALAICLLATNLSRENRALNLGMLKYRRGWERGSGVATCCWDGRNRKRLGEERGTREISKE
eukprot:229162-Amorphochlora_amoeboformis.AAC.1